MKKILLLFIVAVTFIVESQAQFTRYIVKLKDKGNNTFSLANPSGYHKGLLKEEPVMELQLTAQTCRLHLRMLPRSEMYPTLLF